MSNSATYLGALACLMADLFILCTLIIAIRWLIDAIAARNIGRALVRECGSNAAAWGEIRRIRAETELIISLALRRQSSAPDHRAMH